MDNFNLYEKFKDLSETELVKEFESSCYSGNLNVIKHILTTTVLQENLYFVYINNHDGFNTASYRGHLEIVKYLLTSPDLKAHADIHFDNDFAFRIACKKGHLEMVKFLTSSIDLKEHANLHAMDDWGFTNACFNEHYNIVKYLIFDMNIEKTKEIKEYLKDNQNEQVENMFKVRELNKQLKSELCSDNTFNKRMKI